MTPLDRLGHLLGATRATLTELIAPAACPICNAEAIGPPICDDCRDELLDANEVACPRCALPVGPWSDVSGGCSECRGTTLGFDAAMALGPYFGPIRALCLRLKHDDDAWLARWLARAIVEARADALLDEIRGDPEAIVVPVPLHWSRRIARGYNQAEALAESIAGPLGLRLRTPLRRVRRTAILAGAGRAERARRLRGAFRIVGRPRLGGRTVLLVDDILTTGATCSAAARALKDAGAARVVAVVVARAEGKG